MQKRKHDFILGDVSIFKSIIVKLDSTQKSGIINLVLKPISMLLSFVYVPLLISYLGVEKYGLWATILTVISWINYCDIGIGQGLRNLLTIELTKKEYEQAKSSISTAYVILSIISFVLLIISVVVICCFDINKLFNTNLAIKLPLLASFFFVCINFILALSNMILYSLQLSEGVPIRNCAAQLINIVGIKILSIYSAENLLYVAILFGLSTSITYLSSTFNLIRRYKFIRISVSYFDKKKIKEISNVGIKFFLIQIPLIVLMAIDNILITNQYGSSMTTSYSVLNSVFSAAYALLSAFVVPYWSQTTAAVAQGNIKWIKQAAKKLNMMALLFSVFLMVLASVFEPLARIWLGKELLYPPGLITVVCCFYILLSIIAVNVQIINGTGYLNIQVVMNILMGICYIPLALYFSRDCGYGVMGIKLTGVIFNFVSVVIYPLNLLYIIKKIEREQYDEN